jgi:hypothetical protein
MDLDPLITVGSLGLVGGLAILELWSSLPAHRPLTRPRASTEETCPFCKQGIDDGAPRVRCRDCGTRHHAGCWEEHRGCSVFACGSLRRPIALATPSCAASGDAPVLPDEPDEPDEPGVPADPVAVGAASRG